MGYRHKLGILKKKEHEKIKDLTYEDLLRKYQEDEDDPSVSVSNLTREIFDLGKHYDDKFLRKHSFPLLEDKNAHKKVNEDSAFYGITKEGFLAIIEKQRHQVLSYFREFSEETWTKETTAKAKMFFREKIFMWGDELSRITPYNLEGDNLVHSDEYEYSIFELVMIYKSVDWENEIVTITAW